MNFGALHELERNACLLEDIVADTRDVWPGARRDITPRSLARIEATLARLNGVADSLQALRVDMHRLVREARSA